MSRRQNAPWSCLHFVPLSASPKWSIQSNFCGGGGAVSGWVRICIAAAVGTATQRHVCKRICKCASVDGTDTVSWFIHNSNSPFISETTPGSLWPCRHSLSAQLCGFLKKKKKKFYVFFYVFPADLLYCRLEFIEKLGHKWQGPLQHHLRLQKHYSMSTQARQYISHNLQHLFLDWAVFNFHSGWSGKCNSLSLFKLFFCLPGEVTTVDEACCYGNLRIKRLLLRSSLLTPK